MKSQLQNIANLFKNVRSRSILLLTGFILLFGLLYGVMHFINKKEPVADASIQLKRLPEIKSVPGGLQQSPPEAYQSLQAEQNLQQAAIAEKTGGSAIPTLLDSNQFGQNQQSGMNNCYSPCNPCCNECAKANAACLGAQSASTIIPLQPSQLRSGTLVYDTHGKVIGRLGADGKVRDNSGQIIGQVGPDGLVRAKDGRVIGSTAVPAMGDRVYDATGRLIGTVGSNGEVRDAQGRIIGRVGPDGIVRNLKGAVIGKVASSKIPSGAAVYDEEGHLLGSVGADGKMRDAHGKVLGEVGVDGVVRNADGEIIGKVANSKIPSGAAVYDEEGHLLGSVGADGKVRDAHGKVLGEVGVDGVVRNADGEIIGKVANSKIPSGAAVYDEEGHLLGSVGADGKVRDAHGKVLGEVGADGVVRNADGEVIGHTKAAFEKKNFIPGSPAYDNQGNLLGTLGSDGKIRDANGKVVGSVDKDGFIRGLHNEVIGKLGATQPGAPVYDKQGNLIGTVGADGIVRDAQGRALGHLGLGGVVRDAQGNILGSTTVPARKNVDLASTSAGGNTLANTPAAAAVSLLPENANPNPELQAILDRQAQQISAQKADQLQQQMQASMGTQAGQLFAAWASPNQQYVAGSPVTGNINSSAFGNAAVQAAMVGAPAVKAGTIMYAVLLTALNSDEPGPVLAEIVQGKFKGGRLIGGLNREGQKVLLTFKTLTLPKVSQSIPIDTVAIDESTARTALSSYTNNHYWLRYGTLFASAFIQGYGQSFINSAPNYNISFLPSPTPVQPVNPLSPRDRIFVGLGQVGLRYSQVLADIFNTPPTVHVYSGTAIGILFVSDLAAIPDS